MVDGLTVLSNLSALAELVVVSGVVFLFAILLGSTIEDRFERRARARYPDVRDPIDWREIDRSLECLEQFDLASHITVVKALLPELAARHRDRMAHLQSLEQKIGVLVAINALLIGLIASSPVIGNPVVKLLVVAPSLLATTTGLLAVGLRPYEYPTSDADFGSYLGYDQEHLVYRRLYNNYWCAIANNRYVNAYRVQVFSFCYRTTIVAFSIVLGWLLVSV